MSTRPITIKVSYFGPVREVMQISEDLVTLAAGATVRDLIAALVARRGDAFRDALFFGDGEPLPTVTLLLDGRDVRHRRGIDTAIEADGVAQVVVLPPPLGGG
jgi:molybdopterin converting factor small subunit